MNLTKGRAPKNARYGDFYCIKGNREPPHDGPNVWRPEDEKDEEPPILRKKPAEVVQQKQPNAMEVEEDFNTIMIEIKPQSENKQERNVLSIPKKSKRKNKKRKLQIDEDGESSHDDL